MRQPKLRREIIPPHLGLKLIRLPRILSLFLVHRDLLFLNVPQGVRLVQLDSDFECEVALPVEDHEKVSFINYLGHFYLLLQMWGHFDDTFLRQLRVAIVKF